MEPKVIQLVPGYGVTYRSMKYMPVATDRPQIILLNVFFTEEDLVTSSCYGNGTKLSKRAVCISKEINACVFIYNLILQSM